MSSMPTPTDPQRWAQLCRQLAKMGIPTETDPERLEGQASLNLLHDTKRMDIALESASVPLIPGGYERGDLIRASLFLLVLLWVVAFLFSFACQALLPTYTRFYDVASLPYSAGLSNFIWMRDHALPILQWVTPVAVVWLFALSRLNRFRLPRILPGRTAYNQAMNRVRSARVTKLRAPSRFAHAVELHTTGEAQTVAKRLRTVLPFFFSLVVGGGIVAWYAYVLFLPIVQLLHDLSSIETMRELQ